MWITNTDAADKTDSATRHPQNPLNPCSIYSKHGFHHTRARIFNGNKIRVIHISLGHKYTCTPVEYDV